MKFRESTEFFSILRSVVDQNKRVANFLFLSSASIDLLNQSSESLAEPNRLLRISAITRTEIDDF